MHLQPSSRQGELIALARRLACERFAPRADRHDRDASFPFDDYADLRAEGLLGLCVPERHGGLGADYETYCLVAEQLPNSALKKPCAYSSSNVSAKDCATPSPPLTEA
jgi:alkylation response protein AidB-like acyl-CoA dehydrogenase